MILPSPRGETMLAAGYIPQGIGTATAAHWVFSAARRWMCHHGLLASGAVARRGAHPDAMQLATEEDASHSHALVLASSLSPLARYRSLFPPSMFERLEALFATHPASGVTARSPEEAHPSRAHAVDIGCACGLAAAELAHRGFRVTGVEADRRLLAAARASAAERGDVLDLLDGSAPGDLEAGCADLVTVMHGLHLMQPEAALGEAARLLRAHGFLAVAWNDRDLSSPFVLELEGLLERISPEYAPSSRQHGPQQCMRTLQHGGAFRLESFTVHPHSLPLESAAHMADLFASMSMLRGPLSASSTRRKAFYRDVRRLAEAHFPGSAAVPLPLEAKLYIMKKQGTAS